MIWEAPGLDFGGFWGRFFEIFRCFWIRFFEVVASQTKCRVGLQIRLCSLRGCPKEVNATATATATATKVDFDRVQ